MYAVLGNPVEHSRSPAIHAAFAAQSGVEIDYRRVLCPLDGFADGVRAFVRDGGQGCNVTVPFKFEALALARRVGERAALAGAANFLRFDGETEADWFADNTDGVGLVRDIERHAGVPIQGKRVLLAGAGGAAAGALGALIECRPAELVLANRTLVKAQALAARHGAWAARHGVALRPTGLDDPGEAYDIVINSSASSLQGAAVPVPASVLARGALALDMMYGTAAAPFLAWARSHGAEARDGLGMLVEQAAESFRLWFGVLPETASVLAGLRAQLEAGR